MAFVVLASAGAACAEVRDWRALPRPWTQAQLPPAGQARAVLPDGRVFALSSPRITADEHGEFVRGVALVGMDRTVTTVTLPVSQVAALEVEGPPRMTRAWSTSHTWILVALGVLGFLLGLGA